ncbi:MAG: SMC-Scp complex subunit ScpB [Bacteroidota bacterium]
MEKLAQHIEALVFATDSPASFEEIKECLELTFEVDFSQEDITEAIGQVQERFATESSAIELVEIGGGYQFMTKGSYHGVIATWLKQTTNKRLSRAALETLSIIAYKQPVTKSEAEAIRGVSCDYSLQKLLEKELVSIIGRSDRPGRPLLYGTSAKFMDYFGLKNLKDLPQIKDFKGAESEIGERAPVDEEVDRESFRPKIQLPAVSDDTAVGIASAIELAMFQNFSQQEEE